MMHGNPSAIEPGRDSQFLGLSTLSPTGSLLLPPSKLIAHHPKAGVNSLVDAAAYLFSIIGKLKQTKTYLDLLALQKELVHEITLFQENIKTIGYGPEYILVSRYAICATLDDVIMNTAWGSQGHWGDCSLVATFNQEAAPQDRFFLILERISKDPKLYINVMELMYICLSLGFKGSYRASEYSQTQLEQVTYTLYKQIRAYRGDFSKTLSPYPVKPVPVAPPVAKKIPVWLIVIMSIAMIVSLFAGLSYLLDATSNQTYQELIQIGKSILYETHV